MFDPGESRGEIPTGAPGVRGRLPYGGQHALEPFTGTDGRGPARTRHVGGDVVSVQVANLRKTYGSVVAVDNLSFEVPGGSFFAFLGANGAGKSTTIGCITTTLTPTSGSIRVCGHDVVTEAAAVRKSIGAVFQQSLLDPLLTVRENLASRARLYGLTRRETVTRIAELTSLVDLRAFLDHRYGRLSGGQKRRADIARAILHRPSVLFLDEPTSGLDPQSREQIWSTIGQLRAENGTTVFLLSLIHISEPTRPY